MRFKVLKFSLVVICFSFSVNVIAQRIDNSTWKAQIALGLNLPSKGGFIDSAPAQTLNFPTVNLGVQRMFSRTLGAKIDYGFNRFKNDDDSPEFKVNYSRISAQLVYNPTERFLKFLPSGYYAILHGGPGIGIAKPLGNLGSNKQSYLNFITGLEFHYTINRKISIYTDLSYIYGFTSLDDYNPESLGLGAFNGNILSLTFGVSISLSGCRYCQ